ncbi:MAG: TonB-dependent receptor [Chromatiales bacterium]|nr:TonB-dependent receptor [Chromatiales bacterium]
MRAFGGEHFISIATGSSQPISQAPAVASVITAEDIRKIGARDLDEVLETVPGMHVSVAPRAYLSLYTIRGIYSENNPQVLVLINGIPITNLYVGNRGELWGGMQVNDIERIEIVRGPGSAIYGADAFSGTINIITKQAKDIDGTEVGVRAGSYNTREGWLLHGTRWHGLDIALSFQALNTDGQDGIIAADAQTYYDAVFGTSASRAPGEVNLEQDAIEARVDISKDEWRLRLGYQGRSGNAGAGTAYVLDPDGTGKSRRISVDLSHNTAISQYWDLSTVLSYFDTSSQTDLTLYPAGAFAGTFPDGMIARPDVYERHTRLDFSAFYRGFENHSVRIGAGAEHGDMYRTRESKNYASDDSFSLPIPLPSIIDVSNDPSLVFMMPHVRNVQYVSLQDEWDFAPLWRLTSGVRYDHYSDFGDTFNPRIALVWQTKPDFTTKLLYGRAFRAPAFNELYNINNPVALGNPKLKPETINSYELAFNFQNSRELQTSFNLFYYEMSNVIRFVAPSYIAQNTGQIDGYGFELEAHYDLSRNLQLLGNYAYQHSIDRDSDSEVANAPKQQVYLRGTWNVVADLYFSTQAKWIIDRVRDSEDSRSPVSDYVVTDMTLRYRPAARPWELAVSARNIFNEDAREPAPRLIPNGPAMIPEDLPLPGRNFFVEARYKF